MVLCKQPEESVRSERQEGEEGGGFDNIVGSMDLAKPCNLDSVNLVSSVLVEYEHVRTSGETFISEVPEESRGRR